MAPAREGRRAVTVAALTLCAIGGVVIVAKALLSTDGYLSPDSTNYLSLVENLRAGRGLVTPNSARVAEPFTPFAEWPVGYPLLIYAVGWLTGASSFAASKLVSVALFLGSAAVIARAFARNGGMLACVMCFAATLELFAYSWSEAPFTFLLIVLAAVTARVLRGTGSPPVNAAGLAAVAVALFLTRYVGALAVAQLALLALVEARRGRWRSGALIAGAAAMAVVAIGAYLRRNFMLTGHPTGMARPASHEPAALLAHQLALALRGELALAAPPGLFAWPVELALAVVLGAGVAALAVQAVRHAERLTQDALTALSFIWVGGAYLAAIIAIRWFEAFDPYDFRLLDPGFLPLYVGLFALILDHGSTAVGRAGRALLLGAASVSMAAQVYDAWTSYDGRGYLAHARAVQARYAAVPTGSTTVFGDRLTRFLRPDLHVDAPCTEQGEDCGATWDAYLAGLAPGRAVYVDIGADALARGRHSLTVRRFVASHRQGELVRVR